MKLDVTCMRYLTKDDYRVLVAVEMGMRNHEMVPVNLIHSIAQLRHGGSYRILSTLLRHKLVAHTLQEYDGYRLSYLGYDILALHTLQMRGIVASVGNQIGVGKESDIFEAMDPDGNEIVIKIHRLGRTSFRAVRKTRDYLQGKSKASWLYMSRLAAVKEFAFMKALYVHGFPTPIPLEQNRHIVAMSRVKGFPMAQIRSGKLDYADAIFQRCLSILRRLAEHGLIHCDFNEFNLMIDEEDGGNITLIDFPQMVSTGHYNASELLQRDINGLIKFFAMKMKYVPPDDALFSLEELLLNSTDAVRIDEEVRASGFDVDEDDDIAGKGHNHDLEEESEVVGDDENEHQTLEAEEEGEEELVWVRKTARKADKQKKGSKSSRKADVTESVEDIEGDDAVLEKEKAENAIGEEDGAASGANSSGSSDEDSGDELDAEGGGGGDVQPLPGKRSKDRKQADKMAKLRKYVCEDLFYAGYYFLTIWS